MKSFTLIVSFLFITISLSYAQNTVQDTHPGSDIFAIDYSTGQETLVTFDAAVLFKDALIDLVSNTTAARMHLSKLVPGRKNFVITQMDPQTSGNAYQLVLQAKAFNQTNIIYTFMYNVDQNTLSFFDQQSQSYVAALVQGPNLNNLANCSLYGKFNLQNAQAAVDPATQAVDPATEAPVDVNVTATTTPPAMPEYQQPECPTDGYLWQPGYWAFSPNGGGYYWVPGAWVAPPSTGLLWTPPYWAFVNGVYAFNAGYWGNNVGYYGGIYYGYGYGGEGYYGGTWREGHFRYNTAVVRVNTVVIHNTYVDRTVIVENHQTNRASFNGRGGVIATPTARDVTAMHEHHVMATPEQNRNQQLARADKSQFASANGGKPVNLAREKAPARSELVNAGLKAGVTGGAAKPGTPGSTVSRPVSAGAPGAKPGLAGGPGAKPGVAGAPGTGPAGPGAKPGIPGAVGTKPVGPGTRADVPAVPGATGAKPGVPGATPAVPGGPGAKPGAPGIPGTKPGGTGTRGTRPAPVKNPPKDNSRQKDPPPKKS